MKYTVKRTIMYGVSKIRTGAKGDIVLYLSELLWVVAVTN